MKKMKCKILLICCTFFVSFTFCTPANCCKVTHIATAEEISDGADVIVRVRVPKIVQEDIKPLEMTVLEVLKGSFSEDMILVEGQTTDYCGPNDVPVPYSHVRPGGRTGYCYAYDYKPGAEYLLFIRSGTPYWSPQAATNEEITGIEDPWYQWIVGYLEITVRKGVPTTTFNGQADSVTLVAYRAVNQTARFVATWHCRSNQRAGACR